MANTTGAHDIAQSDRGQVAAHVVEPTPHSRVDRNVFDRNPQIPLLERGGCVLSDAPGRRVGHPLRAGVETDLGGCGLSVGRTQRHGEISLVRT